MSRKKLPVAVVVALVGAASAIVAAIVGGLFSLQGRAPTHEAGHASLPDTTRLAVVDSALDELVGYFQFCADEIREIFDADLDADSTQADLVNEARTRFDDLQPQHVAALRRRSFVLATKIQTKINQDLRAYESSRDSAPLTASEGNRRAIPLSYTGDRMPEYGMVPRMSGTYTADLVSGTLTLTLNVDNTATMALRHADAPAIVELGTWEASERLGTVDVTFQKAVGDSIMSMTLSFSANGDILSLNSGEASGLAGLSLLKQRF